MTLGGGDPGRLERATATNRKLLSSSSLTFVSRAFAKAVQVLFLVVVARVLSEHEFASYSYVLVIATAFTIVSDTGVPLISSRDIAAGRGAAGDLFWGAVPVVAVSAALAALGLLVFGLVDSGPGSSAAVVAIAAAFVFANRTFDFLATTLRGLGRFQLEAALQAIGAAAFIAGGLAAAAAGLGVEAIIAMLMVKELVSALVAYVVLHPQVGGHRRTATDWRPLLRAGIRLSLAGTALAVVMRLPLTVLGNTGSAHEVALFSAAQRFGDAAIILATTIGFALLPGLSYLSAREPRRVRSLLWRVVLGTGAASLVLSLVAIPFSGPLMEAVFGAGFRAGGRPLEIMLLGLPAYSVLGVCWYALIALDAERRVFGLGLAGLAVSVACSFLLVPAAGATGAAWTYAAPLALMALGAAYMVRLELASPRPPAAVSALGLPGIESVGPS